MGNKARPVPPGSLVLMCEMCDKPIFGRKGFLTVHDRRWSLYHDHCAEAHNVACGVIPSASGNRPCKINASLISTSQLLLTTLATLAVELKTTDWLQLVQRVVFDTEWYFDTDRGQKANRDYLAENAQMYEKAGFTQKLTEARGA